MWKRISEAYRREVRGEDAGDGLPGGVAADALAIWFVACLVLVPLLLWYRH